MLERLPDHRLPLELAPDMKTLPGLTIALALLTSAVQAQEPTLTLSNGKVFNATMVEGMAVTLASIIAYEKLHAAVLSCYANARRQSWTEERMKECLEGPDNLEANSRAMKVQVDSNLADFMSLARAVESSPGDDDNDTTAAGGHSRERGDQPPVGSVTLSTGYELPAAVVEVIYWDWITVTLMVEDKDGQLQCLVAHVKSDNDERAMQVLVECMKPFHESIKGLKTQHEEADRQLVELADEMGIR